MKSNVQAKVDRVSEAVSKQQTVSQLQESKLTDVIELIDVLLKENETRQGVKISDFNKLKKHIKNLNQDIVQSIQKTTDDNDKYKTNLDNKINVIESSLKIEQENLLSNNSRLNTSRSNISIHSPNTDRYQLYNQKFSCKSPLTKSATNIVTVDDIKNKLYSNRKLDNFQIHSGKSDKTLKIGDLFKEPEI